MARGSGGTIRFVLLVLAAIIVAILLCGGGALFVLGWMEHEHCKDPQHAPECSE